MEDSNIIKVGIGCLVFKENKVLLGKRKKISHGNNEYTCGGGHLKFGEDPKSAAIREIKEEWNIEIDEPQFLCVTNITRYEGKHYIDMGFRSNWVSGEPKPSSDNEFFDFSWYDLTDLPKPLFGAVENYFITIKTGKTYFEN
jgi:8-oxo-dGTP diphosphatase